MQHTVTPFPLPQLLVTYDEHISQEIAEQTDDNGLSILSLATLQGLHPCAVVCLTAACIYNCFDGLYSLYIGDLKMVKWIVDNFANIGHISDSKGNLPIHFAAASGEIKNLHQYK